MRIGLTLKKRLDPGHLAITSSPSSKAIFLGEGGSAFLTSFLAPLRLGLLGAPAWKRSVRPRDRDLVLRRGILP